MVEIILLLLASIAGFQVVDILMETGTYFGLNNFYTRYLGFKPFNCDFCMGHWIGLLLMLLVWNELSFPVFIICWFAGARIGYFLTGNDLFA